MMAKARARESVHGVGPKSDPPAIYSYTTTGSAGCARSRAKFDGTVAPTHRSAASACEKPPSEMGMPMPASSVWKMMKTAVLPDFNCSMSLSSTTTCA